LRIVAGQFQGRVIKAPAGNLTHPMSEKIRGAIFNALGDIEGLAVLDAFTGSGAIAIEASSRGASSIIAIDKSLDAVKCAISNIKDLGINNIKVTRANVSSWSDNNLDMKFDVIICDPPYDKVQLDTIKKLEKHLKDKGVFVLSLPPSAIYSSNFLKVSEKDYNDAKVYFYKNN